MEGDEVWRGGRVYGGPKAGGSEVEGLWAEAWSAAALYLVDLQTNKQKFYFPIAIIIMFWIFFFLTMASSILAKITCFGFVFIYFFFKPC